MINNRDFKINGDGEQVRDWVYVKDVADANIAALSAVDPSSATYQPRFGYLKFSQNDRAVRTAYSVR